MNVKDDDNNYKKIEIMIYSTNFTSHLINTLTINKQTINFFVCEFLKKYVKSKLYHIESSKTRGRKKSQQDLRCLQIQLFFVHGT